MAKTLIAYFSWSGKTKKLAEAVAQETNADLFEIRPVKKYSTMYLMAIAEAKMEHLKHEHPQLAEKVTKLEEYDVVLLGFPIWWYTCPNVILSFLEDNDLRGKRVIPFCTYGSSGKGSCEKAMTAVAPEVDFAACVEATGLKELAVEKLAAILK